MANQPARSRPSAGPRTAAARPTPAREPRQDAYGVLHHRIRLGIVSALAGRESMSFTELRSLLDTTDGNLSVHARKLEAAQFIACEKSFADRRPLTEYRLTSEGRRALQRYLDHMEAIIESARDTLAR